MKFQSIQNIYFYSSNVLKKVVNSNCYITTPLYFGNKYKKSPVEYFCINIVPKWSEYKQFLMIEASQIGSKMQQTLWK